MLGCFPSRLELPDVVVENSFGIVLQQRGFLGVAFLPHADGRLPCFEGRRVVGNLQHVVVHHRNLVHELDELLHPGHALHVGGDAHSQLRGHLADERHRLGHLRLQFAELLADCVLRSHRRVGDAESVQRVLRGAACDGEHGVDDRDIVGHLAQFFSCDAVYQLVGGYDGLFAERFVLRYAIVERQSVVLFAVQQVHVANQFLALFEQVFRGGCILLGLLDARQLER